MKDNNELFDRIFTLELKVGFLTQAIITVLDRLSGEHRSSDYLLHTMENIRSQLPNTPAGIDERFDKALGDAIATIERSRKQPNQEPASPSHHAPQEPEGKN
ncbi:TPA: hypothetical protein ACYUTL_002262 [Serratia marcescens]|jgi:hypothetical protein